MAPEELPISFFTTSGKYDAPAIAGYRKKFQESRLDNPSFEELLTSLVKMHFLGACQRMMPLLETILISSIQVNVNISGLTTGVLATYETGNSDAAAGKYVFTAKSDLLFEYLDNYFGGNLPLSPDTRYTWEHEIIHMLDHCCISGLAYRREGPDATEILVELILSFRSEGIAELFYFMKNHSQHRSIRAARTQFLRRMESLRNWAWDNPLFVRNAHRAIRSDRNYYTIGTWMVLHVMGCEAYRHVTPEAALVAEKIRKRQEMPDEEIIRMVKQALEIDNHSFIDCLTKRGPDGKPFVEYDELYDLARSVELCRADLKRNWSKPTELSGDPMIVRIFRLMRPK